MTDAQRLFLLDIEPYANSRVRLRLSNGDGVQLRAHEVTIGDPRNGWEPAFDTRTHLERRMREGASPADALAEVSRFVADRLLGTEITTCLLQGIEPRTLLVRLPRVTPKVADTLELSDSERLMLGLWRTPWELACAPRETDSLVAKNVALRMAFIDDKPGPERVVATQDKPLRMLLVFAGGPTSTMLLAARAERDVIMTTLFNEVMPTRNVEVDVLVHGLVRNDLVEQFRAGYDIVHWSGHGKPEGLVYGDGQEILSGESLARCFQEAGAGVPSLFVLAACSSAVDGVQEGNVSTARVLLGAGVPQVIAMRDAVRDTYARLLVERFYVLLLRDGSTVERALTQARNDVRRNNTNTPRIHAGDHADPVLFAKESLRFIPEKRQSAQRGRQHPRPPLSLSELKPPRGCVGRNAELGQLRREWLDRGGNPIAVVTGHPGMGKTTLAAEVITLWHSRFSHVLAVQSKVAVPFVSYCADIHARFLNEVTEYRELCERNPRRGMFFVRGNELSEESWLLLLRQNMLDLVREHRVLLVLDNFETNLWDAPEAPGIGYGCKDPAWDTFFDFFVEQLGDTQSRLLVTSRYMPRMLQGRVWRTQLGAMSPAETKLFLHQRPHLEQLQDAGGEDAERLENLLNRSGGHPFVLARLDAIVKRETAKRGITPAARAKIDTAIAAIEVQGFSQSAETWADGVDRGYVEQVAFKFADWVLGGLPKDARRLLWMITRSEEAIPVVLARELWASETNAADFDEVLEWLLDADVVAISSETEEIGFHGIVAERAAVWMQAHPDERGGRDEAAIQIAMGEWYRRRCDELATGGQLAKALHLGRRAIHEWVRARHVKVLCTFAQSVITSTNDPMLLSPIIDDFEMLADANQPGEESWNLRWVIAEALARIGQYDEAGTLYGEAATGAEAAEHWEDLGIILQNWALAAQDAGQLDVARQLYQRSAEMKKRTAQTRVNVLGNELEPLRIDVKQGRAGNVLSQIAFILAELRSYRTLQRAGVGVPEAPNAEMLARTFSSALDIAMEAHLALGYWQVCLDLIDEREEAKRSRGETDHELARTRFNRYGPLLRLADAAEREGRKDDALSLRVEAKDVVQNCLKVFHAVNDIRGQGMANSALAKVWDALGDVAAAIGQEYLALDLLNNQQNSRDRAISHHNLSGYLSKTGNLPEAAIHWLAGIVYCVVTEYDIVPHIRDLPRYRWLAVAHGTIFTIPQVTDLLADDAFVPLRQFLQERGSDVATVQAMVDEAIAKA